MGHRDLLVTHNLSYASILPRLPTRSVRRTSGFVQTGFEEISLQILQLGELLVQKNRAERSRIVTLWSQEHSEIFG
jgi:hypothetical protein